MKEKIIEILGVCIEPELAELKAKEIMNLCNDSCSELLEALKEITKGEGRFDMDRLRHAGNVIEDMKSIAEQAIKKVKI